MNHSNVKSTTKKRAKAVLSVFLVVAILIAGAYAFLSATDSKTNVFTVGNVDIELHEIFNGKDYGKGEDPGAIGDKIENIVPGQSIEKAPYVVNTGKNPAYTFIAVGIPTDTSANVYNGQGTYTAKTELDIKVKAYAIQQQYNGATDAESTWTNYFKNDMISGTASDAGIELFTLNNGTSAVTTGTHTIGSDWQEFSTPYSVNDGGNTYTYHFFKYVANNELLPVGTTTAHLFDKVVFNENIGGDTPPEPVTINYLLPEDDTDTLAGEVNLAATSDIPEGYRLVESKTVMPGESIGDVYFDASMDKSTENKTGDYIDAETGEVIYSNLRLYKDTNALYTYSDAGYENIVPQKYLCFDDTLFIGVHASYWDEVNTSNKPCTVIIPSKINLSDATILGTVKGFDANCQDTTNFTQTSKGCFSYLRPNSINISQVRMFIYHIVDVPSNLFDSEQISDTEFRYSLKDKYKNIKMNLVLAGGIERIDISDAMSEFTTTSSSLPTDDFIKPVVFWNEIGKITVANGTKIFQCDAKAESVSLPNSLDKLSHININQTEFIVPDSVTKIGSQCFDRCQNLKSLILSHSLQSVDVTSVGNVHNLKVQYKGTIEEFKSIITNQDAQFYEPPPTHQDDIVDISDYGNYIICSDGFIKDGYSHYTSEDISTHLNETVDSAPYIDEFGGPVYGHSHYSCDCGYSYDAITCP